MTPAFGLKKSRMAASVIRYTSAGTDIVFSGWVSETASPYTPPKIYRARDAGGFAKGR